jgi:hypothetical protein
MLALAHRWSMFTGWRGCGGLWTARLGAELQSLDGCIERQTLRAKRIRGHATTIADNGGQDDCAIYDAATAFLGGCDGRIDDP